MLYLLQVAPRLRFLKVGERLLHLLFEVIQAVRLTPCRSYSHSSLKCPTYRCDVCKTRFLWHEFFKFYCQGVQRLGGYCHVFARRCSCLWINNKRKIKGNKVQY